MCIVFTRNNSKWKLNNNVGMVEIYIYNLFIFPYYYFWRNKILLFIYDIFRLNNY